MTESNEPSVYNHQHALGEIERMNKELDNIKEQFIKVKVQAHILLVDLVTQFSPHMVEKLRNVNEDCRRCSLAIDMQLQRKPVIGERELSADGDSGDNK